MFYTSADESGAESTDRDEESDVSASSEPSDADTLVSEDEGF